MLITGIKGDELLLQVYIISLSQRLHNIATCISYNNVDNHRKRKASNLQIDTRRISGHAKSRFLTSEEFGRGLWDIVDNLKAS